MRTIINKQTMHLKRFKHSIYKIFSGKYMLHTHTDTHTHEQYTSTDMYASDKGFTSRMY